MVGGVAGGMAEYFGIDPTFVRLGWLVALFASGFLPALALYAACCLIVPRESHVIQEF